MCSNILIGVSFLKFNKVLTFVFTSLLLFALVPFVYANEERAETEIAMGDSSSPTTMVHINPNTKEVEVFVSNNQESNGILSYTIKKLTPTPWAGLGFDITEIKSGTLKPGAEETFSVIPEGNTKHIELELQSEDQNCSGSGKLTLIKQNSTPGDDFSDITTS